MRIREESRWTGSKGHSFNKYAYGGRGGEFSDLLLLPQTGQLLTFDDRTGIIFELMTNHPETQPTAAVAHDSSEVHGRQDTVGGRRDVQAVFTSWETWHRRQLSDDLFSPIKLVPRWILADGDGDLSSGFKSEWSSIQDGKIIIGSHGYEVWPYGGPYEIGSGHTNVQWVKQVDLLTGAISHVNWTQHFNAISAAVGVKPPGYLTHEAAEWSSVHNRWFFLPRRLSLDQPWDPILDGQRGCTLLISCSITFHDIKIVQLKMRGQPERGFSAMRFVPGTQDRHIVATRTVEIEGADKGRRCSSYITVIDLEGNVLMPETFLGNHKYEGLEIMGSTSASVPNLSDALN
ncbi:hypothetical protein CEUSTIGMA_g10186.t1 [Chlamydomonas eustigma]|uniref:Soluble calcium-activated nucleotidase 1 n=1 Tax=Chlamydomonas eustigma TaxID=1157962 RepID=A0A250XIY8_9CHLO|nr:hypothetical protein CEUSTIGMA_g10186.t1 [Chlamydomonas eustigma]|eukprot:GAX82760.1 hypothetical protein CEUSTIGMA_g10186.t1 [Chlamydomonas eustigma]